MKKGVPIFYFPHFKFGNVDISESYPMLAALPTSMGVYMLTDSVSNKNYIGSSRNIRMRCYSYFNGNSQDYAKTLFSELHPGNITVKVLELVDDVNLLRHTEQFWIDKMNTQFPNGLNVNRANGKGGAATTSEYKQYVKDIQSKGACWYFLNSINRFIHFIDSTHSEIIHKRPVIRVGQVIFVGERAQMECIKITPVSTGFLGPPKDNHYTLRSKSGKRVITVDTDDILIYFALYNDDLDEKYQQSLKLDKSLKIDTSSVDIYI